MMATDERLAARIREVFVTKLHIEPPADGVDMIAAGLLDSLNIVALLLHVEQELGIKVTVDDVEIDDFRTIDGIARCLERQRSRL
jgi:acyl carrier protein